MPRIKPFTQKPSFHHGMVTRSNSKKAQDAITSENGITPYLIAKISTRQNKNNDEERDKSVPLGVITRAMAKKLEKEIPAPKIENTSPSKAQIFCASIH